MVRDIEIPIMEETYGQNPKKSWKKWAKTASFSDIKQAMRIIPISSLTVTCKNRKQPHFTD